MLAFAQPALLPRNERRHLRARCRTRPCFAPPCVVRAAIADGPRTAPGEQSTESSAPPFDWIENWYPVIPEEDAPVDDPYAFSLFDSSYVLFRVAPGCWSVLDDRCSHRLAPLSEGRLVRSDSGDVDIECAYHGWGFSGCGACTRIPQLEAGAKIPRRANVRSYRTMVDIGVIWVYLGNEENAPSSPPIPEEARNTASRPMILSAFMRIVPYGYETLMENVLDPEHVLFAHNGLGQGNREDGGKMKLSVEKIPGTHHLRLGRQMGTFSMPGVCAPPSVMCVTTDSFAATFLVAPSKRRESRVILISSISAENRKLAFIFSLFPRWFRHFTAMTVLDGDSILLRGMENDLDGNENWRTKFLLMEKTCDVYVGAFRKWMDKHRQSMPWQSEEAPPKALSRHAVIDRFHSHTMHCKSCMAAFKFFERAVVVAELLAQLFAAALVCLVVISYTSNPVLVHPEAAAMRTNIGILLVILTSISLLARILFAKVRQRFLVTDVAREIYLKP